MKTKFYLLVCFLAALCFVACGTHPEPDPNDPNEQPDTLSETSELIVTPMQIATSAEGGEYTLEIKSNIKWQVKSNVSWLKYNPGVGTNNGKVTVNVENSNVAVPTTAIITISEYGGSSAQNVEVKVTRAAVEGSNLFSVSEALQVVFSPGNLQYQASTKTWRFAEHQYDMIREGNKNISDTYDGWIDLFGWGTGKNPTLSSTSEEDYGTFTDWGINKIANDVNSDNNWRTLNYAEWNYLYEGRGNADKLYSQATVNGVCGCVFLPDKWVMPEGLSFTPVAKNWTTNTYSVSDWEKMEQNGAIFLPSAGNRVGTEINVNLGADIGVYWSSSEVAANKMRAWNFCIYKSFVAEGNSLKSTGNSVRLVR